MPASFGDMQDGETFEREANPKPDSAPQAKVGETELEAEDVWKSWNAAMDELSDFYHLDAATR